VALRIVLPRTDTERRHLAIGSKAIMAVALAALLSAAPTWIAIVLAGGLLLEYGTW